jgi:Xaa-Pro dipeptidase
MTNPTNHTLRQNRLRQAMAANGQHLIALNPGQTLTYLTGLHFHLMERPTVMLFPVNGTPILVLPALEQAKVQKLAYPLHTFPFGDDPSTWAGVFQRALQSAGGNTQPIGVEPTRWRFLEMDIMQTASPTLQFVSAANTLDGVRVQKDSQEIVAMRKAVRIAEDALRATLPGIVPGISEAQVAAELTAQLLKAGSDSEIPFAPIVAAGENSANPHATPSNRRLRHGDLLVIDWGAAHEGYISDLTRTFAIGAVDDELSRIATIVLEANQAGRETAAPGVSAASVDAATRQVIEAAGYGEYFTHRTGHGIGMEAHETPYIRAGNEQALLPGMTFTIEPGIYLPERGGVRIEDNVVITEHGTDVLSSLPRELIAL